MERFAEKSRLIKVILQTLERGPHRREKLFKTVLEACGSTAKFRSVFQWLQKEGLIAKADSKHTAPYVITPAGRIFLKGLRREESK